MIAKPYWAEGGEPKDIETSIGASATFYCNASGDPQPELEWYINGVRLKGIHKLVSHLVNRMIKCLWINCSSFIVTRMVC